MRLHSIRARMTVAFTLCVALLMLTACQLLAWYARSGAERNARTLLEATIRKVTDDLVDDEHRVPLTELPDEEREIMRPDSMALLVVNARGEVVERSQPNVPNWPQPSREAWRIASFPFAGDRVILALPWRKTEQALQRQALMMMALSLFVTVAAAVGAWLLVGRTLSPIRALAKQAQTASAANLNLRLKVPSQDAEIVELVSTLNGLLSRVADTVAAKERFHAAASHELRTPLQSLSGHLELALNRDRSNTEYRQFIEEANRSTQKLTALTRDLLLLHQLDAAQPTTKTEVSPADICERVLRSLKPLIQKRALCVETDLAENIMVEAAPTHAEMLIRNLLENAVKYALPDSPIRVRLQTSSGRAQLDIFNACAPFSEPDLARLFEPFYRPDASRHADTGGTGLGLAICKAIADANGWNLTLRQENNGLNVSVVFSPSVGAEVPLFGQLEKADSSFL